MLKLKRSIQAITVLLLANLIWFSFSVPSSQGTFQVEVGQKIYYEVKQAKTDYTFEGAQPKTCEGFNFMGEIFPLSALFEGEVTAVSAAGVTWDLTIGAKMRSESMPADMESQPILDLFTTAGCEYLTANDPTSVYSSGEFQDYYFSPFYLPPIVDVSPANWDLLGSFYFTLFAYLPSFLEPYDSFDYGGWYVETNGLATFSAWYIVTVSVASYSIELDHAVTFAYNMTTGILTSLDLASSVDGKIYLNSYSYTAALQIELTTAPHSSGFNFGAFFANYKWYIIGGGAGLIAIVVIIPVVVIISRKKKPKKKSKN